MAEAQNWEYLVKTLGSVWSSVKDEELEMLLNTWGQEGWEIISTEQPPGSNKIRVVAKRPTRSRTRRSTLSGY